MVVGVVAVEEENVKERERDVVVGVWVVGVVAAEAKQRRERERRERGWREWRRRGRGMTREEENALRGRKKMHCALRGRRRRSKGKVKQRACKEGIVFEP